MPRLNEAVGICDDSFASSGFGLGRPSHRCNPAVATPNVPCWKCRAGSAVLGTDTLDELNLSTFSVSSCQPISQSARIRARAD